MHKTVFVAIAALCLTAPSLVQADVVGMSGHVRAPAGQSVGHRSAAHAMIQRQRFNSIVRASQARSHIASTNPSHGTLPHLPNQNMPASPGFHSASPGHVFPHAPGQTPTASADHLHDHKFRPLGRQTPRSSGPTTNPFNGQSDAQVRQAAAQAEADRAKLQAAVDSAKQEHLPPAIQNSLQQQRDAATQREADARLELANRAAAGTTIPPTGTGGTGTTTPPTGTGGTGTTTPPTGTDGTPPTPPPTTVCIDCKIIRPGGGGFGGSGGGGSSGGGGQVSGGGSGAPGPSAPVNQDPGYSAPRYSARPTQITDKPVCLSGTWAMQDQQRQYVCVSWFYQGRIYTPDQLEQVLAQR
jgi:hypothetical protein